MDDSHCSVCSSSGFSLDKFRKLKDDQQEDCLDCLFEEWQARQAKQNELVFNFGSLLFRSDVNVVKQ